MSDKNGLPPEWWYARSRDKIEAVLNLSMAWSWLIQYKVGIELTQQVIRPFDLQDMLDWLTTNLQLRPALYYDQKRTLLGNQHSIQEAIIMLHSVGGTLGRVTLRIVPETTTVTVAIIVTRVRNQPPIHDANELLSRFGTHWRERSIAFELRTAIDFLEMNKLMLRTQDDGHVLRLQFAIPVQQAQQRPKPITPLTHNEPVTTQPPARVLQRQHWHLPAISHRVDALLLRNRPNRLIQPVPHSPERPGGWHKPTPRRKLQVTVSQTPVVLPHPYTARSESEPPDDPPTEVEETGGQEPQDKLYPKGSAHDGQK